jgi:hypothetical protein
MGTRRRRRPVDPTDDWEQLELLCFWEALGRHSIRSDDEGQTYRKVWRAPGRVGEGAGRR